MLPDWKTWRNQPILLAGLVITLLVYAKTVMFPGISWDDPEMVFANKALLDGEWRQLLTQHYVGNYTPVTMLLYALEYKLFGNWSGGFHLVNLLLHLFNGMLVFSLSSSLFNRRSAALLATVLFLMHPIQVESVVWISELKNILSTTFLLIGLYHYIELLHSSSTKKIVLVLLFSLLAFLSKPSTVVLPLIMLLVPFLLNQPFKASNLVVPIITGCFALIIGLYTIKTQEADHFINYSRFFDWPVRLALAGFALINYVRLLFVPMHLSVIYPFPTVSTAVLLSGSLTLFVFISSVLFFWYKKKRFLFFILGWFLLLLIPVLQLLPFGEVLYADRYVYVAIIAVGWIIGWLLPENFKFINWGLGLLLCLFSLLTFNRINDWRNSTQLYKSILNIYPNEYVTLNSLGVEMMNTNFDGEALNYLNKAIKASPKNYKGYFNRGLLHLKNGNARAAISDFNQVLGMYDYVKAWSGRAAAYLIMRDYSKALEDAREALKRDPRNLKAHFVLAGCYNEMGNIESALSEYSTCIELAGGDPDTYLGRAIVFGKLNDYKNAEADLNAAIALRPDFYEAFYWRAVVRINSGKNGCDDLAFAAQHNFAPAIGAYQKYCP